MINVSAFGLRANLTASNTFPNGFIFNEFSDDGDPLDSPDLEVAETAFGPNGDMIIWSKPNGIEVSTNLIPGSPGDVNLAALLEANRTGKNKTSARDVIGIVWTYPNGLIVSASVGGIISGPSIPAVSSAARLKTHMYKFRFEQVSKTGGPTA